jgi:hypothetical protein
MTFNLQDMTIQEIAILHEDDPANEGALVKLAKSAGAISTPREAHDYLMQRASEAVARVKKSGAVGPSLSLEQHFEKLLTAPANSEIARLAMKPIAIREAPARPVPVRAPTTPEYDALMAKAADLAAANGTTEAVEFAKLYESPAEIAKRRAKGAPKPPAGDADTDDSDVDASSGSGEMDDADEASGMALSGHKGGPVASTQPGGCSVGRYQNTGHNIAQNSRQAVSGPTEGSYNDKARPASAKKSKGKSMKKLKKLAKETELLKRIKMNLG